MGGVADGLAAVARVLAGFGIRNSALNVSEKSDSCGTAWAAAAAAANNNNNAAENFGGMMVSLRFNQRETEFLAAFDVFLRHGAAQCADAADVGGAFGNGDGAACV